MSKDISPTLLRPDEARRDRSAKLRSLLESLAADDIPPELIGEMARLLVGMSNDTYRIEAITNQLAILVTAIQDFHKDYLSSRKSREEADLEEARKKYEEMLKIKEADPDEIEFYKIRYEKAREKIEGTSQKLEAIQLGKQAPVSDQPMLAKAPWVQSLGLDGLLKDIVKLATLGLLYFVGRAVWTYFKAQLQLP